MKIQLFYIATSAYNKFADDYFESVPNVFPDAEKKIDIFTDDTEYYNKFRSDHFYEFTLHKIFQLPYPILPLMKFSYMKDYIDYDVDIVIFVDADSIFVEKSQMFWNNLYSLININKVLISYHTLYVPITHPNIYRNHTGLYYDVMFLHDFLRETDQNKKSYIPNLEHPWIQSCFCVAPPRKFYDVCKKINFIIGEDLKLDNHIAKVYDESYMNKIFYDYYSGNDTSIEFIPNIYVIRKDIHENFNNYIPDMCFVKLIADDNIKKSVKLNLQNNDEN